MGFDSYGGNYEAINNNEGIQEQNIPSFSDVENNIKQNYELNKTKSGADKLALKQYQELQSLKERNEKPVLQETKEQLDREAMINEAKKMLYEKLGINDNLESNNWGENFSKGIVDTLVLDNYDLAIQIWETNGKIIIDSIKQLFSSWENIKKLAKSLGESVMGLFRGDPYELGKSIVDLGLIGTGVGLGFKLGKKGIKIGLKQISKLRKGAEKVVESLGVKKVIGETIEKTQEIIPKKELDIEAVVKNRVNIQKKIEGLEKLGFPESISKDILESGLLNEEFYGGDLLKRFDALENKGIDYNALVDDVIKQTPDLTREEALLIFTYTDNTIYRSLNAFMRGDKNVLGVMTKENVEASRKLALKLERAMEKMPNLEGGKHGFILRGDKWDGWHLKNGKELKAGEEIDLEAFTSVSNNRNDILLGEKYGHDILIEIIGKEGRVKDISSLAMFVNFADKLGAVKTEVEGIILPSSVIRFVKKENVVIDAVDSNRKIVPHNIKKVKGEQIK